jgi:hypothetical protein
MGHGNSVLPGEPLDYPSAREMQFDGMAEAAIDLFLILGSGILRIVTLPSFD